MTATFALLMSAFAIIQLIALRATVNALEARHDARLKALENRKGEQGGKGGQVPERTEYISGSELERPPLQDRTFFNTAKTVHDNELAAFEWGVNYRK